MAPKSMKPKILKVVRTDAFVKIRQETTRSSEQQTVPDKAKPGETKTKSVQSMTEIEETAHEAPLPAFDTALQALAEVACKVLGLPNEWKKGITVISVAFSHTEQGIRSAAIGFVKELNATSGLHPLKTPVFQIDDGKTPEQGRMQCAKKHSEAVIDFIKQAQRYAAGERSQQLLKFEDADDGEDDDNQGKIAGIGDAGE